MLLEDIRQQKLSQTTELLKEIEIAEDAKKLKNLYMYKIMAQVDYEEEQRLIKQEYKSGVMDPSREVARIEKQRNNKQTLNILRKVV